MSNKKTNRILDHLHQQIFLFYFNSCSFTNIAPFEESIDNFFFIVNYHLNNKEYSDTHFQEHIHLLIIRYMQLIVYTRNMFWGMGRRLASYALLYYLSLYFPYKASLVIDIIYDNNHASWCDIKYLTQYVSSKSNRNHSIIIHLLDKVNNHLRSKNPHSHSICKWIPRETSSQSWIFHKLWKRYKSFDSTMTPKLYRKNFLSNSITNTNKYPKLKPSLIRPGTLLKNMMNIISLNTFFTDNIESQIEHLNNHWKLFENEVKIMNPQQHNFVAFLDLSDFCDHTFYDMIAWAYLISCSSTIYKRFFISTSIANWFNLEHCETLFDIAQKVSTIWKQYGKVACDPKTSINLFQQSLFESGIDSSIDNFHFVFAFANNTYNESKIQSLYDSWTFDTNILKKPHFTFWNFCVNDFISEIPYDIFSKDISIVSGVYKSTFSDIMSLKSNYKRLNDHLLGIPIL